MNKKYITTMALLISTTWLWSQGVSSTSSSNKKQELSYAQQKMMTDRLDVVAAGIKSKGLNQTMRDMLGSKNTFPDSEPEEASTSTGSPLTKKGSNIVCILNSEEVYGSPDPTILGEKVKDNTIFISAVDALKADPTNDHKVTFSTQVTVNDPTQDGKKEQVDVEGVAYGNNALGIKDPNTKVTCLTYAYKNKN